MYTLQELQDFSSDPSLKNLIGKNIIVGLWQYYDGKLIEQAQCFGEIISFDQNLLVQTLDGERSYFPVKYDAIIPAPRGKYTLTTTGQEIINPDYLLSWRVNIVDPIERSTWQANTAPHIYSITEEEWDFEEAHDPDYNKYLVETRGHALIGKTILIGIRVYEVGNGVEKFVRQTQKFGVITKVGHSEGINIQLRDGSIFTLPPDIAMIQPAPEGEYELQSSGEKINNPDFITQWRVTSSKFPVKDSINR